MNRCVACLCLLLLLLGGGQPAAWAQRPVGVAPPDTTADVTQPDSLRRRFDEERLLNGLKAYTKRKTLLGKAASVLLRFSPPQADRAGLDAQLLDRQYARHNFKIVRRINITTLDAFGYNINDLNRQPRNVLEKAGNGLHIKTARSRVRQVLLFRPGQELEPQELAESERLLRRTAEILDARVFVNEVTTSADSVDIEVVTKDVFSITGGFQLRDVGAGIIDLRDRNFLGLGHDFRSQYEYGRNLPQRWSYNGSYQIPFRDFVYGQVRYRNEYQKHEQGVSLGRGFYSINTRYAYALSLDGYNQSLVLPDQPRPDTTVFSTLRYTTQDAWLGRSLRLPSYDLGYENPGRLIVAARVIRKNYRDAPAPSYFNSTLFYGTLGYSVRHYEKDRYLFGFGRTEDVPTGTLLALTSGYEFNRQQNRHYYGLRAAAAHFNPQWGYLYGNLEFGSYLLRPQNDWQQGQLNTDLLYFTRLYHNGNFQWRHFVQLHATLGFRRLAGEYLLPIEGNLGLRGFNTGYTLRGQSRFVFNYEANLFTPISLLGFRVAGIAFADVAWLSANGQDSPFTGRPYSGFGLGLRLRNEYTVFRTIQLLVGFYPRGQSAGNNELRLFETSRTYVGFNDFSFGQPNIVQYQ